MNDQDDILETAQDAAEDIGSNNFFIDILTGNKESASVKKLLVQKVLRQFIESYGFDRDDLEVNYNPRSPAKGASVSTSLFSVPMLSTTTIICNGLSSAKIRRNVTGSVPLPRPRQTFASSRSC